MKVLIIGIDGATLNIIQPMVDSDLLPNISKLIHNGVYGTLTSVFPPITFPAWTSFKTGKNPGKHGVFDFIKDVPYIDDMPAEISIGDPRHLTFWKHLSNQGYRVGVVNVPTTYPPEKVNGVFISGFGTPSKNNAFVYPSSLKKMILNDFNYEFDIIEARVDGKEEAFLETLRRSTTKITNVVVHLLKHHGFDFFMVNYMAADQTQHFFYGYKDPNHPLYRSEKAYYADAIEAIYSHIDTQIGRILDCINEDVTVMIVSDHGFGIENRHVYLNEWLEKEGLLTRKKSERKNIFFSKIPKHIIERLTDHIPHSLSKYIPKSMRNKATGYISWTNEIDWKYTKAYSGGYPGKIYVNLKGREKQGIIAPGIEQQNLLTDIEKRIRTLTDPQTSETVVDDVYRREDHYSGTYERYAPDLDVVMKDFSYLNRTGFRNGQIFYPPQQRGNHRLNGTFIASGPYIKDTGEEVHQVSILDIAPTILHLYNVPIDKDMDGKILKNILRKNKEIQERKEMYIAVDYEKELIKKGIKNLKV